jgi:hypothetical protein
MEHRIEIAEDGLRVITYSWYDPQFGLMWTQSDLLHLGWTMTTIRKQLGDPDCWGRNPHRGAYVRLYSQDRVRRAKLKAVTDVHTTTAP